MGSEPVIYSACLTISPFREVLPKRFGKYGLTVHPTKTKLVPFCPPSSTTEDQNGPGDGRPGTLDLLGFTHYWGRSLRGYWVIKQKTAANLFGALTRGVGLTGTFRSADSNRS